MAEINSKKVLILAGQGVEQVELTSPRDALKDAGAQVVVEWRLGESRYLHSRSCTSRR